jgi:hypothetical protein
MDNTQKAAEAVEKLLQGLKPTVFEDGKYVPTSVPKAISNGGSLIVPYTHDDIANSSLNRLVFKLGKMGLPIGLFKIRSKADDKPFVLLRFSLSKEQFEDRANELLESLKSVTV